MTILLGQEKPSLEDLAHHGIKGMKWGVRKQEGGSTESRADRRKAHIAATTYMVKANSSSPTMRKMTPEKYAALSNRGKSYAAGMELHRITKTDQPRLNAGSLYVSKMKEDQDFYKAIIPATGASKLAFMPGNFVTGGRKVYESYDQTLTTTQKLKLPSDKQRVDAFMDILSKPVINVPGRTAPITGREYLEAHGYEKQFKNKSDQQATFLAYYQFLRTQGNQSSPINQAYFDHLRAKGYNAVLDENDAGRYSKEPLIILNADKSVKSTSIQRLTADEINEAQRKLRATKPPGAIKREEVTHGNIC